MPYDVTKTETKGPTPTAELLAAGKALGDIKPSPHGFAPVVVIPDGYKVEPLAPSALPALPDHIRQVIIVDDAESFTRYVQRFGSVETVLFATLPQGTGAGAGFLAVFDYHAGGKSMERTAGRCAHRVSYPCPFSLSWTTWMGIHGKALPQPAFIEHVQNNMAEITAPDGATVLELATGFESRTDVEFASKKCRTTGGLQLTFKETIDAGAKGGTIKVFDAMTLQMPVFEGGRAYDVAARVEWNPRDGKLSVTTSLYRPADIIRRALADLADEITDATGMLAFTGKPEMEREHGSW